jgi:LmbE family N-acetylglucosaminyl deacetylase
MNVVAIGAHPDDVEIGCAGTLRLHVENKDNVYIVIVSHGAFKSPITGIGRDRATAKAEAEHAGKIIGVKEVIFLNYPTLEIPYNKRSISAVEKVLNSRRADIIYTHWTHDTHQDHRRVAHIAISAGRYITDILMYEPMVPAGRSYIGFRSQFYADISTTIDTKIGAIRAHRSQLKKYGPQWIKAIKARAIYRGYEINAAFAECFEVVRRKMRF